MKNKNKLLLLYLFVFVFAKQSYAQPSITSFAPSSGTIGSVVKLSGTNFNSTITNNIVYFGTVQATVIAVDSNSLSVIVPKGASYQTISALNKVSGLTGYSSRPFVVTFSSENLISLQSFAGPVNFAVFTPQFIAFSDLDGDGKVDMVVSTTFGSDVIVFRNTSSSGKIDSSSFSSKNFNIGSSSPSVVIRDVDGDGKPDVITAHTGTNRVTILRNTSQPGSISFASKVDFITGSQPRSVALGDLDKDGRPDLGVANFGDTTISIFRNISFPGQINSSSFSPKIDLPFISPGTFPNSKNQPSFITIGDLDGDDKPELIVTANLFGQKNVSIFKNVSTIGSLVNSSFQGQINFTASIGTSAAIVGDLDGDGKPEIVASNNGTISVLHNVSDSGVITPLSFAPTVNFNTTNPSSGTNYITIADLDGDGKPDIIGANSARIPNGYTSVVVLRNILNSSGLNQNSFQQKIDFLAGTTPMGVAVGDLDGDGKPDIATANQASGNVSVLRNKISSTAEICSGDSIIFTCSLIGTNYQWQLDTGSGFANIIDNSNYTGTNTVSLHLKNVPSSWSKYKYRCIVDGINSDIYLPRFVNIWMGNFSSSWENSANWSCGMLPDNNTDVIINAGSVILNSTVSIKSLILTTPATLTISNGYLLNIRQ